MEKLKHGIYEIYWKSGGSSLAAIGYNTKGSNWIAPCNWVNGMVDIDFDTNVGWSSVKAVKLLIPNDYSKKTKAIKSDYPKINIEDLP